MKWFWVPKQKTLTNRCLPKYRSSLTISGSYSTIFLKAKNGRFQFDLHFRYLIVLTEVLVKAEPIKDKTAMEKSIFQSKDIDTS
ncbi:hypothetical protein [Brevibacillus brevis]|uniref:hypothetical protein n=1 Tax=Brevibacillus brevis TaxID=1393 RepID=UPI001911CD49|nr:hypothetical protein [Brevibacillus brevis]